WLVWLTALGRLRAPEVSFAAAQQNPAQPASTGGSTSWPALRRTWSRCPRSRRRRGAHRCRRPASVGWHAATAFGRPPALAAPRREPCRLHTPAAEGWRSPSELRGRQRPHRRYDGDCGVDLDMEQLDRPAWRFG